MIIPFENYDFQSILTLDSVLWSRNPWWLVCPTVAEPSRSGLIQSFCSANISLAQSPNSPKFQNLKWNGKPWWVEVAFALNSWTFREACLYWFLLLVSFPVPGVVSLPPPGKEQESNQFVMLCSESIVIFLRTR